MAIDLYKNSYTCCHLIPVRNRAEILKSTMQKTSPLLQCEETLIRYTEYCCVKDGSFSGVLVV